MRQRGLLSLVLCAALSVGCGTTTGITLETLAGTWNATELQFTNTANPAQVVDLVAFGATFSITIAADGDYTATMQEPGDQPESFSGSISIAGDVLTMAESGHGSPTPYVAVRAGDTLTLTTTDEEFDFDDDGTEEDASLRVTLRKM